MAYTCVNKEGTIATKRSLEYIIGDNNLEIKEPLSLDDSNVLIKRMRAAYALFNCMGEVSEAVEHVDDYEDGEFKSLFGVEAPSDNNKWKIVGQQIGIDAPANKAREVSIKEEEEQIEPKPKVNESNEIKQDAHADTKTSE